MLTSDKPPPATIRDLAELGDIDMDQITRSIVLVTADDLAGGPVGVRQAVDPAPPEDLMRGRRGDTAQCGQLQGPEAFGQPQ